jgi:chromosome segregation ATPase
MVNAQAAANGAQKSLEEKEELLEMAKRRVNELSNELRSARQELVNTNRAAAKANAAAHEAKLNATRNKRRLANLKRLRASRSSAA